MLFQARLAIDGLGALLDGLRGRLGRGRARPCYESLSQLRLAFVRLEGAEQSRAPTARPARPRAHRARLRRARSAAAASPSTVRPMNVPSWRR